MEVFPPLAWDSEWMSNEDVLREQDKATLDSLEDRVGMDRGWELLAAYAPTNAPGHERERRHAEETHNSMSVIHTRSHQLP